ATDYDELEKDAYSFDGGVTWTDDNFYKIKQGTEKTFDVGQVVVRDYSGNFVSNVEQISLPAKDTVPPQIAISAVNATVTVTAVDETALHATPYSFDSGVTWQAGNSLTISGTKTWQAGEIKVRDAAGNITSSNTPITASDNSNTDCIDVSAYQGYIDWAKVKASGINSAIIRATTWSGGQTTSTGYWVVDPFFELNVKRAKDNGIKVGAYIYTYSFNTNEISQE
ncbi:MAG: GH25 family lysozyme, partial [Oscillospiraceae bacterium]